MRPGRQFLGTVKLAPQYRSCEASFPAFSEACHGLPCSILSQPTLQSSGLTAGSRHAAFQCPETVHRQGVHHRGRLHKPKQTSMHHLGIMASHRVSRLLWPGLRLCPCLGVQRSAPRMLVTDNFGRRPELYDDDTFIPIDEHPASWAVRPQSSQPSHVVGSTLQTAEAARAKAAEPQKTEPTVAAAATVTTAETEHLKPTEPLPKPAGLFARMGLGPQCHVFTPLPRPNNLTISSFQRLKAGRLRELTSQKFLSPESQRGCRQLVAKTIPLRQQ